MCMVSAYIGLGHGRVQDVGWEGDVLFSVVATVPFAAVLFLFLVCVDVLSELVLMILLITYNLRVEGFFEAHK